MDIGHRLHLIGKNPFMQKLIVTAFMTMVFSIAYSQSTSSNEIIVEGMAKTRVKPDLATLTLTIEKLDTVEKAAIMQLNKSLDGLVHSLSSIGFKRDNIQIASYDISSSKNRDEGKKKYTASSGLKLNFQIDNKLIDAFYTQIQQSDITDLDISFETSFSDSLEKAIRLKLIQQAITGTKINAANMAQALGLRIGAVKQVRKFGETIDEGKIEMAKFIPPVIKSDPEIKYNTPFDKFLVEDLELEERITVV